MAFQAVIALSAASAQREHPDPKTRLRLLILFAPVDHPHRDAVCATVAWIAAAEGQLFECYYEGRASGVHYGGGLPWQADPADLRGGTFIGGRHQEQLAMVLDRFDCQAASLGPTVFSNAIADAGIPMRATSPDVAEFYNQIFEASGVERPKTLLVIGSGGGPVSLVPYACHEIVQRQVLAIAGGDDDALAALRTGIEVERLWDGEPPGQSGASVAAHSLGMATRWRKRTSGYLLADPEAAGRWIPTAIRNGWAPIFGIPQSEVVSQLSKELEQVPVVWGRQQDDSDFLALSKAGVAFQLIDPGRPPFPIIKEALRPRAAIVEAPLEPTDEQLREWANEHRVVSSMVFWTGMVRELECLYALAAILGDTRLKAGLALTVQAFDYVDSTPLELLGVAPEQGGLRGQVEALVASAGLGGMIESAAPPHRFADTLAASVSLLAERLGGADQVPKGWWGVMDAPLLPKKLGRLKLETSPWSIKLRYRRRPLSAQVGATAGAARKDLRSTIRESPLGKLFDPIRPFDEARPGRPIRSILEAVKAAGFEYAVTKAEFGSPPTVATGVAGLNVLNYTAGRWDGWTPFETINDLRDLTRAERRLLKSGQPGWLLGSVDSCLWTFSGYVMERGRELREICRWMAGGGSTGEILNVTPRTAARYARFLADNALVRTVDAE